MHEVASARNGAREASAASRAPFRGRVRWQPAWLFMAPSLMILGVFVAFPTFQSFWYSLHDWTIGAAEQPWVGWGNYRHIAADPRFWGALLHTVEITAVSVVFIVVIGMLLATALSGEGIGSRAIRSIFFFPTVVSLTAVGLAFRFLLDPDIGLASGLAQGLGLQPIRLLSSTQWALPTIIAVSVWKSVGFAMIVLVAGIKGIPRELYEAARIDGAGSVAITRYVTIPALRPTTMFVTLMLTIQSLQIFDLVYVMTAGGPLFSTDTLVTKLIRDGFVQFKAGEAAAISWVLLLLIAIVTAIQLRYFRYNDAD